MRFMQAYKRLDNLCRDINGVGVTGYLQDMDERPAGRSRVPGWADDYRRLKQYRHLRNRIAHESDADEETLCTFADAEWLEDFHQRILERTDPLAMYFSRSAQKASQGCADGPSLPCADVRKVAAPGQRLPRPKEKRPPGCTPELLMAAVTLAALAGLVFLGVHIAATFF